MSESDNSWWIEELERGVHDLTPREISRVMNALAYRFEYQADDAEAEETLNQ